MTRLTTALLCIIFLASLCAVSAQNLDIYVHNKLLKSQSIMKGDEVYVSGEELKGLIKESLSWKDDTGEILLNDEVTALKILRQGKTVLVPLKAIAKALGYKVSLNDATGILDVYRAVPPKIDTPQTSQTQAPTDKPTPAPSPKAGQGSPDPLTVMEKSAAPDGADPNTAGLRIYAEITNGRPSEAKNVVATCILKTDNGEVFGKQEQTAGTMAPGEKKEVIFYFNNAGGGVTLLRSYTIKSD